MVDVATYRFRGALRVCGGNECYQLYGWYQWDYGGICACCASAIVVGEWFKGSGCRVYR